MRTFLRKAAPVTAFGNAITSINERFLPEGPIQVDGDMLAGVCIQDGATALTGALWFYSRRTNSAFRVPLPGRPGFIRRIEGRPSELLVGMDHSLVKASIDRTARTAKIETVAKVPHEIIVTGDFETLGNDGTVDPTGCRVVWGMKNVHFGEHGRTGCLLHYDGGEFRQINDTGVCPNGNAFVMIYGSLHLLHVETKSQKIWAMPYDLASGAIGAARPLFSFTEAASFPDGIFHSAMMPDGICHWMAGTRDKLIVAIFDYRKESEVGMALQFDITNGVFRYEGRYEIPGSPRVTCPAIFSPQGSKPVLYFTTADEGLLTARGTPLSDSPNVGNLFTCSGDELGVTDSVPLLPAYRLAGF